MKKQFSITLLFFAVILCVEPLFAQNLTRQSYEKAREIFNRSVDAYGGIEAIRSIQNFSLRAEGDTIHRNQSRRPFGADRTPYVAEVIADFQNNRYRYNLERGFPGGVFFVTHAGFDGKEHVFADMIRKTKTVRPPIANWRDQFPVNWLPQLMLLGANNRAERLRYVGKVNFNNRPHEIISLPLEDGRLASLYIDGESFLISKQEWLGSDAFAGDVVREIIFTGYKTVGDQKVPVGQTVKTDGEMTLEVRYADLSFNKTLTGDEFKFNSDIKADNPAPETPPVTKIGENVYTVRAAGYNTLFVNFKDHIFVMEAPGGDAASREAIARIKETIPGKPIRYLAVTHHHDDHTSGVRAYLAEGATLVTTKGNREYFERSAKSRYTIAPDGLSRKPQTLKIELVENGKRAFTDGATTIELYDIGSGPHTEEMLVAYLPNEKMLFQGDLLDRPNNGDAPLANPTTAHFAEWLETKKLAVEKIVPVHGTLTTTEELRAALAEMRRAQK